MKVLTYRQENREKIGVLHPDEKRIIPLEALLPAAENLDMVRFIERCDDAFLAAIRASVAAYDGPGLLPESVTLCAPIPRPIHDILCVGLNYRDHVQEASGFLKSGESQATAYFSKRAVHILGPGEAIEHRADLDEALDYEVELAVIIGRRCKDVSYEEAEQVIFGYSVFNDLSARTLQKKHQQWMRGKSLDTLSAMGPVILTRDELHFPIEVDVMTQVNGQTRQHSNTRLLIKDIAGIIAELSAGMTLEPGDIIATGTPSGVAMGMDPPAFLKPGDEVSVLIPAIGTLSNPVI